MWRLSLTQAQSSVAPAHVYRPGQEAQETAGLSGSRKRVFGCAPSEGPALHPGTAQICEGRSQAFKSKSCRMGIKTTGCTWGSWRCWDWTAGSSGSQCRELTIPFQISWKPRRKSLNEPPQIYQNEPQKQFLTPHAGASPESWGRGSLLILCSLGCTNFLLKQTARYTLPAPWGTAAPAPRALAWLCPC